MATLAPEQSSSKAERSIPNYRQQLRKVLPDHYFKADFTALLWLPFHAAIIAGGWWLLATHFSWWLAPLVSIAIGHSFGCMGFVAHDICHGGAVKNLAARDLLAGIGFSPFWISPKLWRRWHNAEHHGHTQVEGIDPDHLFTMEHYERSPILQWLYRLNPLLRNLVIFGSFTYRMNQQTMRMYFTYWLSKKVSSYEKLVMFAQFAVMTCAWIGVSLMFGVQVFAFGYLIPLLIANAIVISYIATNHFLNPLADESDVLGSSLTVTLPKGFGWLDAMHSHFGAHVAHHLFPQASPRYVRKIEDEAAKMFPDRYFSMGLFTALKMLWNTPWVYDNKTVLLDPVREIKEPTLGHGMEEKIKR
ncbi:MAG: fatty acid desaturase [Chthonomonas sp.]|nr:fatty acid desaturase [Chthonomonas sp.]